MSEDKEIKEREELIKKLEKEAMEEILELEAALHPGG